MRISEEQAALKFNELLVLASGDEEVAMQETLRWRAVNDTYYMGWEFFDLKNARDTAAHNKHRIDPEFHGWLCDTYDDADAEANTEIVGQHMSMTQVQRDAMKSTWLRPYIARHVLRRPEAATVMLISKTSERAKDHMAALKRAFASPLMRSVFSDEIPEPGKNYRNWELSNVEQLTLRRFPDLRVPPELPQVSAFGLEGTVTGKHPDIMIFDDIIDDDNVRTGEQIMKVQEKVTYLLSVLAPHGRLLVVGTRWHYNDIYGRLMEIIPKEHQHVRPCYDATGRPTYRFYTKAMLEKRRRDSRKLTGSDYAFNCNPGEAPIWMADGTFKRIDQVRVGDKVVGFHVNRDSRKTKLTVADVLEVRSRVSDVVNVDVGGQEPRTIRCTPDHQWYLGPRYRDYGKVPLYGPAAVGGDLVHVIDPVEEPPEAEQSDWAWLGGILDGEAGMNYGSIALAQSSRQNPEVFERIRQTLERLKIDHKLYDKTAPSGKTREMFIFRGGRQGKVDIINKTRLAKAPALMRNILKMGGRLLRNKSGRHAVRSISPAGRERVYSMKTTTGNYVAWGYASKNCQYLLKPEGEEGQIFPPPHPTVSELPHTGLTWYISVDPAYTTKDYSDQTAVVLGAKSTTNMVYVQRAIGFKKPHNELARIILDWSHEFGVDTVGIESGYHEQFMVIFENVRATWERTTGRRWTAKIIAIKVKRTVSKPDRVNRTMGAFCRNAQYFVHEECTELLQEMTQFPHGSDNLVDAAANLLAVARVDLVDQELYEVRGRSLVSQHWTWETISKWGDPPKGHGWEDQFAHAAAAAGQSTS